MQRLARLYLFSILALFLQSSTPARVLCLQSCDVKVMVRAIWLLIAGHEQAFVLLLS